MTNPVENGGDTLDITESEAGDSTSSELERLNENTSPTPSRADTPTERGIARTKRQEEKILRTIEQTKALGSNTLDLSNHGLLIVPSELLELTNLEHLYLEGNQLTGLPDDFFDRLPNLKWLDLRHNYLIRLPSVFTGRHQNLRNLLLEGNNLRTLPLELGMIKTLNGLNITNNPLEFPPATVIEKGTSEILKFLREMMAAKNSGRLLNGTGGRIGLKRSSTVKFKSAGLPSRQPIHFGSRPSSFESGSSDQYPDKSEINISVLTLKASNRAKQESGATSGTRKYHSAGLPTNSYVLNSAVDDTDNNTHKPDRARTGLRRTTGLQQFSAGLSSTLPTQTEEVEVDDQHPERVKTGLRRSVSYQPQPDSLPSQTLPTQPEFSPGDQEEEIKENFPQDKSEINISVLTLKASNRAKQESGATSGTRKYHSAGLPTNSYVLNSAVDDTDNNTHKPDRARTGLRRTTGLQQFSAGLSSTLPTQAEEVEVDDQHPERVKTGLRRSVSYQPQPDSLPSQTLPTKPEFSPGDQEEEIKENFPQERVKTGLRRLVSHPPISDGFPFQPFPTMSEFPEVDHPGHNSPAGSSEAEQTDLRRSATSQKNSDGQSHSRKTSAEYLSHPHLTPIEPQALNADGAAEERPVQVKTALCNSSSLNRNSITLLPTTQSLSADEGDTEWPARVHTGLRRSQSLKLHSARLASQQFPLDQSNATVEDIKQTVDEDGNESSSSSDEWSDDGGDLKEYAFRRVQQRSMSTEEANRMSALARAELVGPVNKSAELHTQLSYTERKQAKTAKIQKAGAMGTVESFQCKPKSKSWKKRSAILSSEEHEDYSAVIHTCYSSDLATYPGPPNTKKRLTIRKKIHLPKTKSPTIKTRINLSKSCPLNLLEMIERKKSLSTSSIFSWKVNQFPEPPPPEYAMLKLKEEQKLSKEREFKEKTEAILQRRKDENILKEWRDESKRMQRKKAFETLRKGTKEYPDTATEAPFGIDEDHLRIPTNEERIKHDVKTAHEKLRRTLSPASRQRIEEEKAARIRELEKRIKQHTTQMHERRKLPKGTPQEEMEAARRELEVAEALHRELITKRRTLEYRFKAFIGDMPTNYHSKAAANHH